MRALLTMAILTAGPAGAQFMTKLAPQTVEEFDRYSRKVEQQLGARWNGEQAFLAVDANASEREQVLAGELRVRPGAPDNRHIFEGLIHDWVGTVFMPHTSMAEVLGILQDFDRHRQIYPSVIRSRLIRREGNDLTGYWRLEYKQALVTVVLDVEQEAHYREVGAGKWVSRAYAKNVSEVENAGTARQQKLPPGEGHGFLWRLHAYWSLEATNGGILGECRVISLSRDVPATLAWAIKPFIESLPRESLAATLRDTRAAATK